MSSPLKRALKYFAIVVGLLLIAGAALILPAFVGRRGLADGVEVQGLRIVKDGIVSIGVIPLARSQVALIDAGNDKTGKAILAELSRRQLSPDAVTAIFLTHGHPDHTASIALFPQAQVMALEREVPLIEGHAGASGPLTRLFPVRPTGITVARALHDGDTVTLGSLEVHVYAVPGHTAGSAAYLVKGVLFLGDAADIASDGTLEGSPWIFSDNQSEDRASLVTLDRRLMKEGADVRALEFAHSGVLPDGISPLHTYAQKAH